MSEENWRHESEHTILKAGPKLRERFRESVRKKLKEEHDEAGEEEIEELAAFAWYIRAKEVYAKADLLIEEGVPDEELRNILRIQPE